MRQNHATEWHCDCSCHKSPGSHVDCERSSAELRRRGVKQKIHEREAEKGNVCKPIEPALETGIAAQPVLLVEIQPEDKSQDETEQDPEPGEKQIQLRAVQIHGANLSVQPETVLIDNSRSVIETFDDESRPGEAAVYLNKPGRNVVSGGK